MRQDRQPARGADARAARHGERVAAGRRAGARGCGRAPGADPAPRRLRQRPGRRAARRRGRGGQPLFRRVRPARSARPTEACAFAAARRRPPLDPVNALLSFLYTLLTHDCRSAAEAVGLDPAVGFLHRDRPGRPSLALDLMEELRPVLADRLALSLINRRQLARKRFRAPRRRRRAAHRRAAARPC